MADLINERKEYTVNILGNSAENCIVKNAKALKFSQKDEIAKVISESDAVFNAVGGKNLNEIVPFLAVGIEEKAKKGGFLNIITCENWKKPADILKDGIAEIISDDAKEFFENNVGITESVVMRSAIEVMEIKMYKLIMSILSELNFLHGNLELIKYILKTLINHCLNKKIPMEIMRFL